MARSFYKKHIYLIVLSLSMLFLSACSSKGFTTADSQRISLDKKCSKTIKGYSKDDKKLNTVLDKQIYDFKKIVSEVSVSNKKSSILIQKVTEQEKNNQPISARQLDNILKNMQKNIDQIKNISKILNSNSCWKFTENSTVPSKKIKIKGSLFELATTLLLYDFYLDAIHKYNENEKIRRLINQGDRGYALQKDQLTKIQDLLSDMSNLYDVNSRIDIYIQNISEINELASQNTSIDYLNQFINTSKAFKALQMMDFSDVVSKIGSKRRRNVRDYLMEIHRSIRNGFIGTFVNLSSKYTERKGKLYQDRKAKENILSHLQIGDILIVKTPFYLTDKMIPGYWSHTAIWIGNETELRSLGVWNNEIVKKYHKEIKTSHLIAEALREGTTLSTIEHFLNVDDIAILRNTQKLSNKEKIKVIILTLRQIGKEYDFNFDIETTDKIVCSQLVYLAYTDMKWPTDNILGRYTISPDNIATKVAKGKELKTILLYMDGKKVHENLNKVMINKLDLLEESK